MAAAVRYAQTQGFQTILIVDWDIHHGDGTQSIFAGDPNVYCLSIHSLVDLYMMKWGGVQSATTTAAEEVGHCNIPILDEIFDDKFLIELNVDSQFYRPHESLPAFREALAQVPFLPDLICIFSGYDSHRDDCGEGITNWTNADFRALTRWTLDLAKQSRCPVLSVHGGGYKPAVTIAAALGHIDVLANYQSGMSR
jgi:acetoin utilization deacetylase AcuC-like enzyme